MTTRLQAIIDFAYKSGGVNQAATALGRLSQVGKDVGQAWGAIATPLNQTIQIFQQVGQAAQQAYAFVSEGTQLSKAQDQFDALAGSIGTTSQSLLSQLKTATRGTVSDFNLMAGASSLVSLGLTNTSEDTVRLTKLIGQLGWDMNQVTLTLANQSTMRLDALGLSVSDVEGRVQALKDSGMAADQAFKFAIIEAGEEKLKLLGDAADTAAGKLAILETNAANLKDNFQATFSEQLISGINDAAGGLFETADGAGAAGKTIGDLAADALLMALHLKTGADNAAELEESLQGVTGQAAQAAGGMPKLNDAFMAQRQAIIEDTAAIDGWMASMNTVTTMTPQAIQQLHQQAAAIYQETSPAYAELQDKIYQTSQAYNMNEQMVRAANLALEQNKNTVTLVTGAVYASTEAIAAYTAATGDYATMAINAGDEGVNLNQVMYDSLDAAGGSAEALVGLALATGQLTEAQAENILKQAAMIEYAKALGEQIAAGTISISDAVTSLADFQAGLEGSNVMVNTTTGSVQLLDDALVGSSSSVGSLQTSLDEFNTSNAVGATQALIDKLNSIPNSIPVEIVVTGEVPTATGGYQDLGGGNQGPGFAAGADFVVPPGYPNDSYPMRVQSGEHVTVTPAGQRRGGDTYNLYLTPANPDNVQQSFNYMRALAGS